MAFWNTGFYPSGLLDIRADKPLSIRQGKKKGERKRSLKSIGICLDQLAHFVWLLIRAVEVGM